MDDGRVRTRTNRSGGIQGGISNGEPIVFRIAFKPTATIMSSQPTVSNEGSDTELKGRGRHDPCVLPRAVPMVEAMSTPRDLRPPAPTTSPMRTGILNSSPNGLTHMLAFNIADIGTIGVIAVILVAFAVIGLVKGLVRMTFGLVALMAGLLAGFWGFQKGAGIAGFLISEPDPWMSGAVGVILGLGVFFVARALFGVILSPVNVKEGKKKNLALPGGLLGFLMGAAFAWFGLSGVRYLGTLAELDWIKAAVKDGKIEKVAQPFLAKLKRAVDGSLPGQFHEKYDFLNDRGRANLAKLTVLVDNELATKTVQVDPQIRDAIAQQQIQDMLIKQSADLRSYIDGAQYAHLLQSDPIKTTSRNLDASAALADLDIEVALGLIESGEEEEESEEE